MEKSLIHPEYWEGDPTNEDVEETRILIAEYKADEARDALIEAKMFKDFKECSDCEDIFLITELEPMNDCYGRCHGFLCEQCSELRYDQHIENGG